MGQLHNVFNSKIKFSTKMKIYKTAIYTLFTYGSEAWNLDVRARRKLNGANTSCILLQVLRQDES
jgi:hypothetical protein